tara:strand:- start:20 stop:259 length:240 start_codon:yes stop_codon:yes gene_type:complete
MEYKEDKQLVLERVPPGDRWSPVNDKKIVFDSLTDGLEYMFQKTGCRDYYLAALDGKIYSINKVEVKPKPPKSFSLYGE